MTQSERITRADVEHVAQLARLALTEDEIDLAHRRARRDPRLRGRGVGARHRGRRRRPRTRLPLVNVLRADAVRAGLDRDEVLAAAPAVEDDRFRVPRILGEAP